MKYLLDTHTFIWFLEGHEEISQKARDIIKNIDNEIYLSKVSVWEMAIKQNIRKLKLAIKLEEMINKANEIDVKLIDIDLGAIYLLQDLPQYHKDPFDRILICQAKLHNMTVISRDDKFDLYDIKVLW